ncbi:hypothetical protein LCGC14_0810840 [marine sediment metagenome]|uniref:HTH deoR-type domain-containing protein n=1 Tax=marine sediment metagenome TaxID=412755 RepID=A0A0F9PLU4_9ZZZZ
MRRASTYVRYAKCPLLTTHGRVLAYVDDQDAVTTQGVAEHLWLQETTVRRALSELKAEGLVTSYRMGKGSWWRLSVSRERMLERILTDEAVSGN